MIKTIEIALFLIFSLKNHDIFINIHCIVSKWRGNGALLHKNTSWMLFFF